MWTLSWLTLLTYGISILGSLQRLILRAVRSSGPLLACCRRRIFLWWLGESRQEVEKKQTVYIILSFEIQSVHSNFQKPEIDYTIDFLSGQILLAMWIAIIRWRGTLNFNIIDASFKLFEFLRQTSWQNVWPEKYRMFNNWNVKKLKMKKVLIHKIIWIFTRKNFNSVSFYLRIRIAISAEGQRQSKWNFPSSS